LEICEEMGAVFGKINEETPRYKVVGSLGDLEVREYEAQYIASVSSKDFPEAKTKREFQKKAFYALAGYLGVLTKPANVKRDGSTAEAISMTAPVSMQSTEAMDTKQSERITMTAPVSMQGTDSLMLKEGEKIDMTAPVTLQEGQVDWTMSFFLPASKYLDQGKLPPKPLDERISISKKEPYIVAVKTFSNVLNTKRTDENVAAALETLRHNAGEYEIVKTKDGKPSWEVFGYNSPFVLPCYRTNEIAVQLEKSADRK